MQTVKLSETLNGRTIKKAAGKTAKGTKNIVGRTIRGKEQVEQEICCSNASSSWDKKTIAFLIILMFSMTNEMYRVSQYWNAEFLTSLKHITFTNYRLVDPRPDHFKVWTFVSNNVLHYFTARSRQSQVRDGLTTLRTTNRYALLMSRVLTELTDEMHCFNDTIMQGHFIGKLDSLGSKYVEKVDNVNCERFEAREGYENIPVRLLSSDQLMPKSESNKQKLVLCAYGPVAYQTEDVCHALAGKVIENADYAHQVSPLDHGSPLRTTDRKLAVLFSLITQFASPLPWSLFIIALFSLAWKHSDVQIVMSGTKCTAFSCIVISTQIFGTLLSLILYAPSTSQAYIWAFVGFSSFAETLRINNALYRKTKKGARGLLCMIFSSITMLFVDYVIFGLMLDAGLASIFAVHFYCILLSNAFYSKSKPWFMTLNLLFASLLLFAVLVAVMLNVQISENNTSLTDYLTYLDAVRRIVTATRFDSSIKFNTDDATFVSSDNHIDSPMIEAMLRKAGIVRPNSTYFNSEKQLDGCSKFPGHNKIVKLI